jgi:hypothetical protein
MPLKRVLVPYKVHGDPEGISYVMTDGQKPYRVFVTFHALHSELDVYSAGPLDQFTGKELMDKHHERIDAAASRKFDAEGISEALDGHPVLFVRSTDL